MWDAEKLKVKQTLKGHETGVWSLHYDASTGSKFCTASPDTTVKVWDVKSGKCANTLKGHDNFVSKILLRKF